MTPNRDAFHLALMVGGLFLAFLIVLGIAAWNTRIAFLPLTPKAPAAPAATTSLHLPAVGPGKGVIVTEQRLPPLGVAAAGHPSPA